ncbi:alpha/beta hydrolase family protein [Pirellulimonas nuda]|nr:hypothetical protein [Pirellulimonas nuda]
MTQTALGIALAVAVAIAGPARGDDPPPEAGPPKVAMSDAIPAENAASDPPHADASEADAPKTAVDPPAAAVPPPGPVVIEDVLLLPKVGDYARAALHRDPVEAAIATGAWQTPKAGDKVTDTFGAERQWRPVRISGKTGLVDPAAPGGYALASVESPQRRLVILEATGHAAVCVNGEWRTGDPYALGWLRLPIELEQGQNELLFHVAAPGFRAKLVAPPSDCFLIPEDATLPDLVEGEAQPLLAAVPVVNATTAPLVGAEIVCETPGGGVSVATLPRIEPLSVFKAPVELTPDPWKYEPTRIRVLVRTKAREDEPSKSLAESWVSVEHAAAGGPQVRTFRSEIDNSVQRYAVSPATSAPNQAGEAGAIVALHGLGVPCDEFLENYQAKPWASVVCPENRRPYGFDWEDWGARSAVEALADAQQRFEFDPRRVYLTGHGVGGHGAWHLAASQPGRFAAVGPSGGWISFKSYGGALDLETPTPVQAMLARAAAPSDTLRLVRNLAPLGVYVLHGEQDDRTPVAQSRYMRGRLGEFHTDFAYREQAGAGAWWGPSCCDWPAMMRFFEDRSRREPGSAATVDFTTINPGASATMDWVTIAMQQQQFEPSRVVLERVVDQRLIKGRTENVASLGIDLAGLPPGAPVGIAIDGGQRVVVPWPGDQTKVWLVRQSDGAWRHEDAPSASEKNPERYGGLKAVFDRNPLLVYGTAGTPQENAWAQNKARLDSETFWYRGNGSLEVVPDTQLAGLEDRNRNVVLYGNRDTNKAWPRLVPSRDFDLRAGYMRLGLSPRRQESVAGLSVLAVQPRVGSAKALVGMIGGTDLEGMRGTSRLRYFFAGAGFPDLLAFGPKTLVEGEKDVRATGFFGPRWSAEPSEIVWRDLAL